MPVDFYRHLVGKTLRNVCHWIAFKYALLISQRSYGQFLKLSYSILFEQVIMQRDDTPIAVDLCPGADRSAVRTALVAWSRRCVPGWPRWDQQTDECIMALLNAPHSGGIVTRYIFAI